MALVLKTSDSQGSVSSNLTVSANGACRQAVKTSDCDSDMRGFKSHQAPQ